MKALSLIALVISCIQVLPLPFWWIELLAHFVTPLCLSALLLIIWHCFKKQKLWAGLTSITLILTSIQLIQFIPLHSNITQTNFKVYNANVLSSNMSHELILKQILLQSPDVITLQEFSPSLKQSLMVLDDLYPYQVLQPRSDNFGIALYSKWPIIEQNILNFKPLKLPTIDALIEAHSLIRVITTHPVPPLNQSMFDARNQHMKELAHYIESKSEFLILTGDFNNTPFAYSFKQFLKQTQLHQARAHNGINATWPSAFNYLGISIAIDHILLSPELAVLPSIDSDHLRLFLNVVIP